jgi:hypothetical protein
MRDLVYRPAVGAGRGSYIGACISRLGTSAGSYARCELDPGLARNGQEFRTQQSHKLVQPPH